MFQGLPWNAFPGTQQTKSSTSQSILRTQKAFASFLQLAVCALLALGATAQLQAADKKADPTGTWSWTTPGRNGGADRKRTLKLKTDGDKLTVTREFNNNKFVAKYHGKLTADNIKGKMETERNGQAQSRDLEAKRETEKKS